MESRRGVQQLDRGLIRATDPAELARNPGLPAVVSANGLHWMGQVPTTRTLPQGVTALRGSLGSRFKSFISCSCLL